MRSSCEERKPSLPESVPFWCDSQSTKNSDTSPGAEYTTNAQISASSITLRTDECKRERARVGCDQCAIFTTKDTHGRMVVYEMRSFCEAIFYFLKVNLLSPSLQLFGVIHNREQLYIAWS